MTQDELGKDCQALVLFGATGDLTRRMLWPSLYALDCDQMLPQGFRLIGVARSETPQDEFIERVREAIKTSANAALFDAARFAEFARRISYAQVFVTEKEGLEPLARLLDGKARGIIYYLATDPQQFGPICRALKAAGLTDPSCRMVVEKPIGSDEQSAHATNEAISEGFAEHQVFRIDHYLGKEAVQNLLALRFANAIFEPLWNSSAIEQVQITVAETVGVEGRWGYYDRAGALRDMVQSHLLQLLCLVAMEPPARFDPGAVRNEKVKVLWSLRSIDASNVAHNTVTGQYTSGFSGDRGVPGYREEEGSNPRSDTETFVALRAEIDNWRWAGVPFYLRTGKRLQKRVSEIVIQFKSAPFNIFSGLGATLAPNALLIKLQPEEMIRLTLMHKRPGMHHLELGEVGLNLSLNDAFGDVRRRIAYERMLLDVLRGNSALFVRRDEVEASWKWVDGIVAGWQATNQKPRPYGAGSWGPSAAIGLPERFGHSWHE